VPVFKKYVLIKGGESMDSPEMRRKQFRKIYEYLCDKPLFRPHHVAKEMGLRPSSVRLRLKEASGKGYITGPQIRKKSFANLKNYVYLIRSDDPIGLFKELAEDRRVIHHGLLDGSCDLIVTATEKLDIKGTICKGPSSDYYISCPPNQPWETSNQNMWDLVRKFDPDDYTPKGYIKTHWDELAEWSDTDEILFWEFKFNLRKSLRPIVKKHGISVSTIKAFLKRLPLCCTILTCYFQESLSAYVPYLFIFETEYEDFIIDVFSQLPTTCWFQRVSGKLIAHMWTLMIPVKEENTRVGDIPELQISLLIRDLIKKEILKSEAHAMFNCYWRQEPLKSRQE
jgi:hypothetical protein